MDSGLPPYLAQQYGYGNDFMGGPFQAGFMNAPAAYMSGATMYGPTYGQFSPEAQALMPTPYGGGANLPYISAFRTTMTNHPFKSFLTYTLPFFTAPKGLTPVFYNNYIAEAKTEALQSTQMMGLSTALGFAGNFLGGPLGAIAGSLLGMGMSKITGQASGRQMQIHEIGNLLHLQEGSNSFGVGISVAQAGNLYKMFAKSGMTDINMQEEEYQLAFGSLARNGMIDDTGDFSQAKENIKKMKNIIVGLQDLFQNGDIKTIVASLRQLRNIGIFTDDLSSVSVSSSVAANMLGQKPTDYITNTIGTAQAESGMTNFSTAALFRLHNNINIATDSIKNVKGYFMKGLSTTDISQRFEQVLANSMAETSNPTMQNTLLSNGIFSAQAYTLTAVEAGLQAYNKAHKTNYSLNDALTNPNLIHTITDKYAKKAMKEAYKKYGSAENIFSHFSQADTSYMATMFDPQAMAAALKNVTNISQFMPGWEKQLISHKAAFNEIDKLLPGQLANTKKILDIFNSNPMLMSKMLRESNDKIKKTKIDEQAIQQLRNDSVEAWFTKIKNRVQYSAAMSIEDMTPSSELRELRDLKGKQIMNAAKVLDMTKKFNPSNQISNLFNGYATFDDGVFGAGIIAAFEGGKTSTTQQVLSHAMDVHGISLNESTIANLLKYRHLSALSEIKYMRGLNKYFSSSIELTNPGESNFINTYENYYKNLKEFKGQPYVLNGLDVSVKDKEGLQVFRELVRSTKELANRIMELSSKKNLTAKEKKELAEDKKQLSINRNSFRSLYTGTVMGGADLFKETNQDITAGKVQSFAKYLITLKHTDQKSYDQLVKGYASLNHVTESVARHNLDLLANNADNKKYFEVSALKASSLFNSSYAAKMFVKGATADFTFSGGSSKILSTVAKFKDMNTFLKAFNYLNKASNASSAALLSFGQKGVGDADESTKKILSYLSLGTLHLTKEQTKAVNNLFSDLKTNWEQYTGGHSITIDGKKISSFKDFANSSNKIKKDFISQIASSSILINAATKLGVNSEKLGSKEGQEMLQRLFKTGKNGGIVEFKNGHFQLTKEAFANLNTEKEKEVLKFFGVGANRYGLHKLVNELNEKSSTQLDKTNNILNKIYNKLDQIPIYFKKGVMKWIFFMITYFVNQ